MSIKWITNEKTNEVESSKETAEDVKRYPCLEWNTNGDGLVSYEQLSVDEINSRLKELNSKAADYLKISNSDHLIYGIKFYDNENELATVHFYMCPMLDEEFNRYISPLTNVMVYAIHRQKKMLNLTINCAAVYQSHLMVPADMTLDQAIEYAKQHLDEVPLGTLEYVPFSDSLDEENCDFDN